MRSKYGLVGMGALAGLGLMALLGGVAQWWWLVVAAVAGLLGGVGLVAINTNLLLRKHIRTVAAVERRLAGPSGASAAHPDDSAGDLTGAVRLLAAQYVGRLDRAQTSLEAAAARLQADPVAGPYDSAPSAREV